MKRKLLSCILAIAVIFGCFTQFVGCGKEKATVIQYQLNEPESTEYSADYNAFPRAKGETQKTIDCLDITGCDWYDYFTAIAVQGYVNRENPIVYVIKEGKIVQDAGIAAKTWLERLDESYGDGVYTINQIDSLYSLILKYYDYIKGAVVYHDRLLVAGTQLVNQGAAETIYGDMAVINYTTMLAAQLDAIPVTESKLAELNAFLVQNGKAEIEVLGDTRELLKDENGAIITDSGSRDVWTKVYQTALSKVDNGDWKMNQLALGHNGTWNAAWYDYIFQHKIFTYNRITVSYSTAEDREIESRILDITPDNTAMLGVWHLVSDFDEQNVIDLCDRNEKFFVVTFGTYNMSWSCGLPHVQMQDHCEKLTYDDEKVYLSFSLSESDNNTATYCILTAAYEEEVRGQFGMTWQMNQAAYDLNPNIIAYMNNTFTDNDCWAMPEAGIGYIRDIDQRTALEDYFGLTDSYIEKMNNHGGINPMYDKAEDALKFIDYMPNLQAMTMGYVPTDTMTYANSGLTYYYHDKPVFMNLGSQNDPEILTELTVDGGTFINVRMAGFNATLSGIKKVIDKLPENYEVVTQVQLIDLYKQKMSATVENVNQVDFDCSFNEKEIAFLWYTDNHKNYSKAVVDGQEEYRYGAEKNELVYYFRLDPNSKSAIFDLSVSGEYSIQASTDKYNWTVLEEYNIYKGDTTYNDKRSVCVELPKEMAGKTVYLRICDPTPNDAVGYKVYDLSMSTDIGNLSKAITLNRGCDGAYVVDEGKNEVTYKLPFNSNIKKMILNAKSEGNVEISVSTNNKNFYPMEVIKDGNYNYTLLEGMQGTIYAKVKTSGNLESLRVVPLEVTSKFTFSPCGSETDNNSFIIGDELRRVKSGTASHVKLSFGETLTYAFNISNNISANPVMTINAVGLYKLEYSTNGKDWTTLKQVEMGEMVNGKYTFDASGYAKAGTTLFVKFTKAYAAGADAALYGITLR